MAAPVLSIGHLNEVLQILKKYYVRTDCHEFGLSLGLSARTLDVIETNHRGNVDRCLLEVLKKWLGQVDEVNSKGIPSWKTLVAALRAIGDHAVANGIEKEKVLPSTPQLNVSVAETQKGNEEVDSSSSVFLQRRLKEEPDSLELLNQLSSIAYRWELIGLGLKVNRGDLESAKNEQSDQLRLNRVLECWKKNMSPPYTWITILDVISGPNIKDKRLRSTIEQFLGTEKESPASAVHDSTNEIEEVDSSQQESILEQNKKLLKDYTVDQIGDWLDKIGLEQYKEVFKKMEVNGRSIFFLTDGGLQDVEQFNMKNKFHRKIVMDIVNGAKLVANQ